MGRKVLSRQSWAIAGWSLVWLLLIDVAVNLALGSAGTAAGESSTLKRYFEYGRSIEGKLARLVAADPLKGGQILSAGWITEETLRDLPSRPKQGDDLLVAVYGQSFALMAAQEAARVDAHITLRGVGGPGAPPSHSYAGYKADAPLRKADVVVVGILSSAVANMGSLSGLIWMFENPAAFTFPRYRLVDSALVEETPLLRSEAQFRRAFAQRDTEWQRFKEQLRSSDRGFDVLTFDETIADASSIVRLIRRGWVAHSRGYEDGVYDPASGFNPESEDVKVLRAMLVDLKRRTEARGERLVVLLLHARGHADHLYSALAGTLQSAGIEYVSTHALFSANDPSNFLADGHYVAAANRRLSAALLQKMRPPSATAAAEQRARLP